MASEYILAHDVGTTGNKAVLFNLRGKVICKDSYEYETIYPQADWAEQNPDDWLEAVVETTKNIVGRFPDCSKKISAVGLSGQMLGCLPLDRTGKTLRRSIIHSDSRSFLQYIELEKRLGKKEIYRICGNIVDSRSTSCKIAWIKENERDIYNKTRTFLQSKDYIAYKMTGELGITDHSDASHTGLYDINNNIWSDILLKELGIDSGKLPEIHKSSEIIGRVTPEFAMETGILSGIPVIIGGGDGACATLGAGVVCPGQAYNYIGATSWISAVSEKPVIDPKMRIFNMCDLDSRKYNILGTVQSAGSSYKWLADQIAQVESNHAAEEGLNRYRLMDDLCRKADPGCRGLFFLPYLMGERSPIWDPHARGAYIGLTLAHRREDLFRSVLEGVAFALKSVIEAIEEAGLPIGTITVIGGGAKSDVWIDIMTNVYGRKVLIPEYLDEATSLGAAIAAGVGIGLFRDWQEAVSLVKIQKEILPDPKISGQYDKYYSFFLSLYPTLKGSFHDLSNLRRQDE